MAGFENTLFISRTRVVNINKTTENTVASHISILCYYTCVTLTPSHAPKLYSTGPYFPTDPCTYVIKEQKPTIIRKLFAVLRKSCTSISYPKMNIHPFFMQQNATISFPLLLIQYILHQKLSLVSICDKITEANHN